VTGAASVNVLPEAALSAPSPHSVVSRTTLLHPTQEERRRNAVAAAATCTASHHFSSPFHYFPSSSFYFSSSPPPLPPAEATDKPSESPSLKKGAGKPGRLAGGSAGEGIFVQGARLRGAWNQLVPERTLPAALVTHLMSSH